MGLGVPVQDAKVEGPLEGVDDLQAGHSHVSGCGFQAAFIARLPGDESCQEAD